MLSKEENEIVTRVGPGTPMGNTLRRYWVPALLASEIPGRDCAPVRVRMLGEDLVASLYTIIIYLLYCAVLYRTSQYCEKKNDSMR